MVESDGVRTYGLPYVRTVLCECWRTLGSEREKERDFDLWAFPVDVVVLLLSLQRQWTLQKLYVSKLDGRALPAYPVDGDSARTLNPRLH